MCLGDDESWSENGSGSGSENRSGSGNQSGNGNQSSSLQNSFKNPLQVIFGILGDTISSRRGVSEGFPP